MNIYTEAVALKKQGLSIRKIAKKLGVSASKVFRALKTETASIGTTQKIMKINLRVPEDREYRRPFSYMQ